jgi:hypothetical protein
MGDRVVLVRDELMRHVDRDTVEVDGPYRSTMRVTFDAETNMAYIHLVESGEALAVLDPRLLAGDR